jgi:hypothetical protein
LSSFGLHVEFQKHGSPSHGRSGRLFDPTDTHNNTMVIFYTDSIQDHLIATVAHGDPTTYSIIALDT